MGFDFQFLSMYCSYQKVRPENIVVGVSQKSLFALLREIYGDFGSRF